MGFDDIAKKYGPKKIDGPGFDAIAQKHTGRPLEDVSGPDANVKRPRSMSPLDETARKNRLRDNFYRDCGITRPSLVNSGGSQSQKMAGPKPE